MRNKKGIQLGQAFGAVLALILVAILVIVSIYLFTALGSTMMTPNTAGTVINETVTSSKTLGLSATLAKSYVPNGVCGAITLVLNGTTVPSNIVLANFTQTGCTVVNASSMDQLHTALLFNYPYTYSASTAASNATDLMTTNFSAYPTLIGLVGTIIFLALVIGVLVTAFAFGGRKGV